MPTSRTKATHRAEHPGAAPDPICHRLFNIRQAADFAGVPVQSICGWIRTHKLEAYILAGGIRIDELQLADCISPRTLTRHNVKAGDGSGPWFASTEISRR